jgi:nicotinamidase-related amidase
MINSYTAPDPTRSALVSIDVQNDFTLPGASACIAGTFERIPAMKDALTAFRAAQRPIIHVVRLYKEDGSNVDICRRALIENGQAIARPGAKGAEIVAELKRDPVFFLDAETLLSGEAQVIGDQEWAVYKPRWSAFHLTGLDALLAGLGVNTLVMMGCNFPNCPRATLYDASSRDFRLVVLTDAMSGLYDKGLDELHGIGVETMTSGQVGSWLAVDGAALHI